MNLIQPGSTIGIVGGGQLGKMLAVAAAQIGYRTHVYCPETDAPAIGVCNSHTQAGYEDLEAMRHFADQVDVVTIEFENISARGLESIEDHVPVRPGPDVLRICQHRFREKEFVNDMGVGTAPFFKVTSLETLKEAAEKIGLPGVLKTASMGYDGKGQAMVHESTDLDEVWASLDTTEAIYEGFVEFEKEISVIVSRSASGEVKCFDPVENVHRNHILYQTFAPALIADKMSQEACDMAVKLAEGMNLEGTVAVEMFACKSGEILVNEMAPRPHNSGHWTIDACAVSQFEQTIRAICGLPLGDTSRLCNAVMTNLIGQDVEQWKEAMGEKHTCVHLYGKKDVRPGRKMGHITRLFPFENKS